MKLPEGISYVYDHIIISDGVYFTYCYHVNSGHSDIALAGMNTTGQVIVHKLYQNVVQPEIAGHIQSLIIQKSII